MRRWLVPGLVFANNLLALLLLYYGAMQIPVAGLLLWALLPLPFSLSSWRLGWGAALLLFVAGAVIIHHLELFFGLKAELLGLGQMALVGLLLVFWLNRPLRLEAALGSAILAVIVVESSLFLFQAWQAHQAPLAYLQQSIQEYLQAMLKLLPPEESAARELPWGGMDEAALGRLIFQLIPALLVLNATALVLLNFGMLRLLAPRLGSEVLDRPLLLLEAPQWLIFLLIGAGFLWLWPHEVSRFLGLNLLVILLALYFLQGLAILAFGLQRFQVPLFFRWLSYLTLLFFKPAALAVIILGISDIWLDYRRLHRQPEGE